MCRTDFTVSANGVSCVGCVSSRSTQATHIYSNREDCVNQKPSTLSNTEKKERITGVREGVHLLARCRSIVGHESPSRTGYTCRLISNLHNTHVSTHQHTYSHTALITCYTECSLLSHVTQRAQACHRLDRARGSRLSKVTQSARSGHRLDRVLVLVKKLLAVQPIHPNPLSLCFPRFLSISRGFSLFPAVHAIHPNPSSLCCSLPDIYHKQMLFSPRLTF